MASTQMVMRIQKFLILGYLIGFTAFIAPVLGFVAPKGLGPLVICSSLLSFLILRVQNRPMAWVNRPIILMLASLCAWSLISFLWSIDGLSASSGTAKLTANLVFGGLLFTAVQSLRGDEKPIVFKWFLSGFILILVALALEIALGGPLFIALKGISPGFSPGGMFWLNNIVVLLALLVWPLALAKYKIWGAFHTRKKMAFFISCGFSAVIVFSYLIGFASGTLALLSGLLSAGVVWLFGRRAAITAAFIITIIGLGLPFGFNFLEKPVRQINTIFSIPSSAEHRIAIWEFTARKIAEKPLAGWGMNTSKMIPEGKSILYSDTGKHYGHALPLHPHNAILQFWLELGLPGIALYLGLLIFIIITAISSQRSKFESAMIFGQFTTIFIISNLSFGIWQAWWIATIWLSASLMSLATTIKYNPRE
jgi:exopolysaccharide production protein ExoQ